MTFSSPDPFITRPTLTGTFGMAASTHWLASGTAQAVLERGGNAFDAAVAAGFVLQVVEPHLNGPGGDLVGIVAPSGGRPAVLMGQGPAPAGSSAEAYRSLGLTDVPGSGFLAAAVPGAVDAWLLLLRDHGTWEASDVWEFARGYARDGHPLVAGAAATIARVADLFETEWTASAAQWLPAGRAPLAGELVVNTAWADTIDRLLAAGRRGSTREARIDAIRDEWAASVAAEIETSVAEPVLDSSGERHAGVLRASDLAGFRASWEEPVAADFRGHTILKPGAWSQGPALLQTLAILDGETDDALDPSTEAGVHLVSEALALALADREAYYGDVDGVPLDRLLSADYARERRALIGETASLELRPGHVDGVELRLDSSATRTASFAADPTTGEPTVAPTGVTRGDTCHVDVVDRFGNLVSITPSGGWLQSSPYLPTLGFALGTRLQMTRLEPGLPTTLTPGRRPRTTLTPTVVLRGGEPYAALGSPGGDQQDQWQLLFLLRHLVGGWDLQEAIDAPAFHTTSIVGSFWPREFTPGGLVIEDRFGDAIIEALERRVHRVERAGSWALGRLSVVTRGTDGVLRAAANPRGAQGYAVGR
ncbi:gamma-glutamyltransferase family protein [Agromyces atrinae]|uniref:Gamma-glutamyltranspeptidase/glutathione hydrolase n=1 Tax=Agromyces atrinae TaxID=592376 RepID=A0A4Q2M244_9MICO|nr:gamma-glutamyltransferase [Agromyces atrinae]NYD68793.1 gamma-glutamyltranspeptidase/glutathione hydrolase [Agromyces atrinae]RXZ85090.1 transferase [Agromyces atrinae]RXZ85829.1 transferase [Agromyces atrinae]